MSEDESLPGDAGAPEATEILPGSRYPGGTAWSGEEVYSLPPIEAGEPRLHDDKPYPIERQFCGVCRNPVGRAYGDRPPQREGYCWECGTWFSFLPKLKAGDVVADRYEVDGKLAHGGLGWIYLARDRRLGGMPVVLKGVINASDERARRIARAERDAMIRLNHPNIVRIFSYVEHSGDDEHTYEYLVMEYVDGRTLAQVLGDGKPGLRLENVTTYGRSILSALEYLHGEGFLYCDLKPANVMHAGTRVTLIDLGGVRAADDKDSPPVITREYAPPDAELREHNLTVRADVHTVGRTLERLFDAVSADDTAAERMAFGVQSLRRLLARAVAGYDARFASAAEMAEQLDGVHREILSLRDERPRRMPSTRFENTAELLDAGLGVVPGLDRWTAGSLPGWWASDRGPDAAIEDGLPEAPVAAVRLPVPRVAENDPAAEYLAAARVQAEPRKLLHQYEEFRGKSVELDLARARAFLQLGGHAAAEHWIGRAAGRLGGLAQVDWRIAWHRGLLLLAKDEVAEAAAAFDTVYSQVPGEVAPKLALAYCFEHEHDDEAARRHYEVVWRRDNEQVSAAFGLARIAFRQGDRAGALRILDLVPLVSRHHDAAQVAGVRLLLAEKDGALPGMHEITAAAGRLPQLYLDNGENDGEARQRLVTILREIALARVLASGAGGGAWRGGDLLGEPVSERGLRLRLERSYRQLAHHARDEEEHGLLIDAANTVRPWTKR